MRESSNAFTAADLPRFFDEMVQWDVRHTRERLRAASERMNQLAAQVPETSRADGAWNAKEILAHIAVLSKAYGVFSYFIASGRLSDLALGDVINQRDAEGDKYMAMSCMEIAAAATTEHQRTLKFLDGAALDDLRRECRVEGGTITAEYVVRLPLVAHLEQHIEQLQEALA